MLINIELALFKSRAALIKNPADDVAESVLSWCIFHLLQHKATAPKELEHMFEKFQ